jgi:hypothetical protein
MPDLVEKFFKEDLTEAEHQALNESLLASDEAALKFEETAKAAYHRYGLPEPEPHWPDQAGPTLPPQAGSGPWNLLLPFVWPSLFLLGAVAVFVGWHHYRLSFSRIASPSKTAGTPVAAARLVKPGLPAASRDRATQALSSVSPQQPKALVPSNSQLKAVTVAGLKSASVEPETRSPEGTGVSPAAENGKTVKPISAQPVDKVSNDSGKILPAHTALTPIRVDENSQRTFSNLSVEVSPESLSFVTIRVLDSRKGEIMVLYRGNVEPGSWLFEWDGKSSSGRPVGPGLYQIEVKSGSFIQHKNVEIQ